MSRGPPPPSVWESLSLFKDNIIPGPGDTRYRGKIITGNHRNTGFLTAQDGFHQRGQPFTIFYHMNNFIGPVPQSSLLLCGQYVTFTISANARGMYADRIDMIDAPDSSEMLRTVELSTPVPVKIENVKYARTQGGCSFMLSPTAKGPWLVGDTVLIKNVQISRLDPSFGIITKLMAPTPVDHEGDRDVIAVVISVKEHYGQLCIVSSRTTLTFPCWAAYQGVRAGDVVSCIRRDVQGKEFAFSLSQLDESAIRPMNTLEGPYSGTVLDVYYERVKPGTYWPSFGSVVTDDDQGPLEMSVEHFSIESGLLERQTTQEMAEGGPRTLPQLSTGDRINFYVAVDTHDDGSPLRRAVNFFAGELADDPFAPTQSATTANDCNGDDIQNDDDSSQLPSRTPSHGMETVPDHIVAVVGGGKRNIAVVHFPHLTSATVPRKSGTTRPRIGTFIDVNTMDEFDLAQAGCVGETEHEGTVSVGIDAAVGTFAGKIAYKAKSRTGSYLEKRALFTFASVRKAHQRLPHEVIKGERVRFKLVSGTSVAADLVIVPTIERCDGAVTGLFSHCAFVRHKAPKPHRSGVIPVTKSLFQDQLLRDVQAAFDSGEDTFPVSVLYAHPHGIVSVISRSDPTPASIPTRSAYRSRLQSRAPSAETPLSYDSDDADVFNSNNDEREHSDDENEGGDDAQVAEEQLRASFTQLAM